MSDVVEQYRKEGKSWKYTTILFHAGDKEYIGSTVDGDGNEIKIYLRTNPIYKSINQVVKEEGITEKKHMTSMQVKYLRLKMRNLQFEQESLMREKNCQFKKIWSR